MNVDEKIVYHGKFLTVTEEQTDVTTYERVHLRGGVHIIPVKDERILLIREYRVHEGCERWKLVGGWLDKEGKTPEQVAREELAEEVGMEAEKWEEWKVRDTHGRTVGSRIHYFVARDVSVLEYPPLNPDDDDVREVRWVTHNEFQDMLNHELLAWDFDAMYILQFFKRCASYGKM